MFLLLLILENDIKLMNCFSNPPLKMCLEPKMVDPGVVEELIRMCTLEAFQKAAYPMQISEYLMSIQMCVVIAVLQRTKLGCRELINLDRASCTQEKTE